MLFRSAKKDEVPFLNRAADVARKGTELVKGAASELVDLGATAAAKATATQMRDPATGRIVNAPPNVPPLNKPPQTTASAPHAAAADQAFEKAKTAAADGNKVDADKWFNIGMALMASGAATLGARGAEAQGFGPFAAGLKAGMPVFAELSKQDKAEKLRRQQLEIGRAHV